MPISDLHARLIAFAQGMPAFAFSEEQLVRELQAIGTALAGSYPNAPAASMGNIPMPVYGLAYSAFVNGIQITMGSGYAELSVKIIATIHPRGRITDIIREYAIDTVAPIRLVFDYDQSTRTIFWREQGLAVPSLIPTWGPDADAILATTQIPEPQRDTFLNEVELPSIFTTKNMFVSLLIALLPSYALGEIAPWLTFLDPLRFDYDGDHVIVTASRAQMAIGGCNPRSITIEPDPNFPYGNSIPTPTLKASAVDFALYLPKTRLIDFTASVLEPAVLAKASGGGFIKWVVSGAFGLKRLTANISTGMTFGTSAAGITGNIGLDASIDYVGAARAWIDGPSGTKIGLATASVLGSGDFGADIRFAADLTAGFLYGDLVVTRAELTDVDFDVDSRLLPWPLDQIAGFVLDSVARDQIRKLTGTVTHLGRWDFMAIPLSYLEALKPFETAVPVMEGLSGVAAYAGVSRRNTG